MLTDNFLFKAWVPEWLVKMVLIIVILPSMVLFFIPMANTNAAAGDLGLEPNDVKFSVVLLYAGLITFVSLEKRFFTFLAAKEYFIIITLIQVLSSYACYVTKEVSILFIFRFIQGMAFSMTVNLSLSLIFTQLKSERARAIGYSIFFGMLVSMIPFNNFATAEIIDTFDFNILYKGVMFSYLPSLVFIYIFMNNVRLNVKFPLYQLDWASFSYYAIIVTLLGYVMVYGQEYYWLDDKRIARSVIAIVVLSLLFCLRQLSLKRPYLDLKVLKQRNFLVGSLIFLIFYICRFAFSITTTYFQTVLKLDPIHIGHITLINIGGIAVGVILSCVYILQHRPIRILWIYGFLALLVFHAWMLFLFMTQVNESIFYVPLFLQGLGVGLIITPLVMFLITSVPEELSVSASGIGLFMRCFGFYLSIGLMNYYELYAKSKHFNTFQDLISLQNIVSKETLFKFKSVLLKHGALPGYSKKAANKMLVQSINAQDHIRYAIDYYEMVCVLIVFTLLFIALVPYLNRTIVVLTRKRPAPL